MKNKSFLLIGILSVLTIGSVALFNNANNNFFAVHGTECTHSGNHYAEKPATTIEPGHKEFWTCCICHESYLELPGTGTWVDANEGTMTGGLGMDHIAYIPSEVEQVIFEANVKSYTPHSYFAEQGTYEFNIFEGTKNLFDSNANVYMAAMTMMESVYNAPENDALVQAAYAQYRAVLAEEYAKDMVEQVTNALTVIYGSINQGTLATQVTAGGGNHLNVGIPGYATWVAIDPTNTSWGAQDNRYWIPEAYKANNIINYAQSISTTLTTVADVEANLDALMCDVARCAGQFIIEAEMYHAASTNGCLTLQGNSSVTEWWYVWTYFGTSGLVSVSANKDWDPATCTNFRLCSAIYNPNAGDFASTLQSIITTANWVIANQVDDMF